ncbi:MAG: hypothetical protein U5K31_12615 [Balneolaceae bacterium]|nr:hypothetical protein [Balneolaceae bacterium]
MGNCYLLVIDGLGSGRRRTPPTTATKAPTPSGTSASAQDAACPTWERLGTGNILELPSVPPAEKPLCAWGRMREASPGKDSTTGHWELAGVQLPHPFPTYPEGFPDEVIEAFCEAAGLPGVLCNRPYSGTQVIDDYGERHLQSGKPIV